MKKTLFRIVKEVAGEDPEAESRLLPQSGTYEDYAMARKVANSLNAIPAHRGRDGYFFVDEITDTEEVK